MTRKNLELIAGVIRKNIDYWGLEPHTLEQREVVRLLARDMADALANTNPAFDRERFLTACGV